MDPLELRTRREALGLDQRNAAKHLGVQQATVSRWESGRCLTETLAAIEKDIEKLETISDQYIESLLDTADRRDGEVALPLYATDEDLREKDPHLAHSGLTAPMQRVCAAHAARILRQEGKKVRFTRS